MKSLQFDGELKLSDGRILSFERVSLIDLDAFILEYPNVDEIIMEISKDE